MEKGNFSRITAAISVFYLLSSVPILAFADNYTAGGGQVVPWGHDDIAIGTGARAMGYGGDVVIGSSYDSISGARTGSGDSNNIAIGSGTWASGGSVDIGIGSGGYVALGYGASNGIGYGANSAGTAIGAGARGTIQSSSIGYNSYANGGTDPYTSNHSESVGTQASASGLRSSAYGYHAAASGYSSAALGANSRATAASSIALGANSVADRAATVSVGSSGHERQIVNVAEGTADTDAANVRQIHKLGALTAAMAGLTPMAYDGRDRLQILANTGDYAGKQAAALGVGYYDAGKSLLLTTGMAFSGSETMARLGIAWKPGRAGGQEAMLADCSDAQATLKLQDAQIRQMQDELKEQQEQAKLQEEQTKEKQARLKELQDQVDKLLQKRVW